MKDTMQGMDELRVKSLGALKAQIVSGLKIYAAQTAQEIWQKEQCGCLQQEIWKGSGPGSI